MLDFQHVGKYARVLVLVLAAGVALAGADYARAANYTVTTAADPGAGGLREAITLANAAGVPATISFDIAGGCATPCTIEPASTLPDISVPMTIDGYTQPGSSVNTLSVGDNAVLKIVLDTHATNAGVIFSSGSTGSVLRGLNFVKSQASLSAFVEILTDGVAVEGNFIGVDASGTMRAVVGANPGVIAEPGSSNVRVGGTAPAQRNVIAGCGLREVWVRSGSGHLIQGNYIGTNAAGNAPIPQSSGVEISTVGSIIGSVMIGDTVAGAGNVISGNGGPGIFATSFSGPPASVGPLTIQGNIIGLDATGSAALANAADGIFLVNSNGNTMGPVLIGGTTTETRNLISGNTGSGIHATSMTGLTIQGNFIGTNAAGLSSIGNVEWGVKLVSSAFGGTHQIGGTAAGAGNVIGGGLGIGVGGISVVLTTATIEGNFIGVGADGTTFLGFLNGPGILVDSGDAAIGGLSPAQRNLISDHGPGISVVITMPGVRNAAKATILGNLIFRSNSLGAIDLGGDGPTPNDDGDGDTGPNGLQNFPVLTSASISSGLVAVSGTFNSLPNQDYRIEWFADTGNYRTARTFLGASTFSTDGSGKFPFTGLTLPIPRGYKWISATATDPAGNTSELSPAILATGPNTNFYTLPPCRIADTRDPAGPYGGPSLAGGEYRAFMIAGQCGVPAEATAVALNLAVTQPTAQGDLRVYPAGALVPLVSAINWGPGRTRANNTIMPLGPNGDIVVLVDQYPGTVDLIIDTSGYFQ